MRRLRFRPRLTRIALEVRLAPATFRVLNNADSGAGFTGGLASNTDPLLGLLADNGGPTRTFALLTGSPAIDAGANPTNLATDQRGPGFLRVFGAAADIGAFEVQPAARPLAVQVNDGSAQRSMVTSLKVTFNMPVLLPTDPATAFQLVRQSDGATMTLNAAVNGARVTLNTASTRSP